MSGLKECLTHQLQCLTHQLGIWYFCPLFGLVYTAVTNASLPGTDQIQFSSIIDQSHQLLINQINCKIIPKLSINPSYHKDYLLPKFSSFNLHNNSNQLTIQRIIKLKIIQFNVQFTIGL